MKKLMIAIIVLILSVNLYAGDTPSLSKGGAYSSSTGNPFVKAGYGGQCTAYAWGRAYEKLGIKLPMTQSAKFWVNYKSNFKTDMNLQENSIVVWGGDSYNEYGHVAFVEKINGNTVYFTEANVETYRATNYGGGYDGYLKAWTLSKFKAYRKKSGSIIGYIHLQSSTPTPSSISLTTPSNGSSVSGNNVSLAWTNPNNYPSHRWIMSTDKSFIDGLTPSGDWSCSGKSNCSTDGVSNKTDASPSVQSGRTYYWKVRSAGNNQTVMSSTGNFKTPVITSIEGTCPTVKVGKSVQCTALAYYNNDISIKPLDITSRASWSVMEGSSVLSTTSGGKITGKKAGSAYVKFVYDKFTNKTTATVTK
jgi:surface antigen